jgi:hypothetical protein
VLAEIAARFSADGIALRAQQSCHVAGEMMAGRDAGALLDALDGAYGAGVFATDDVAAEDPADAAPATRCGLMFVAGDGGEAVSMACCAGRNGGVTGPAIRTSRSSAIR